MRVLLNFFGSFEMVSDGQYHMAELIAIKKNFTVCVDCGLARSIINKGAWDFVHFTTPLFIGGCSLPRPVKEHSLSGTSVTSPVSVVQSFKVSLYKLLARILYLLWEIIGLVNHFLVVL
jgi:hypothetical protein